MKIFISYGNADLKLVKFIGQHLSKHADIYYWDKNKELGAAAWQTIFQWIDNSDLVLALITGETLQRAMAVGQEIGRAKAKNKTIIPLITTDVPQGQLGMLEGITYQRITNENFVSELKNIERRVIAQKVMMKNSSDTLWLMGGIALIAGFAMLSSSDKKK